MFIEVGGFEFRTATFEVSLQYSYFIRVNKRLFLTLRVSLLTKTHLCCLTEFKGAACLAFDMALFCCEVGQRRVVMASLSSKIYLALRWCVYGTVDAVTWAHLAVLWQPTAKRSTCLLVCRSSHLIFISLPGQPAFIQKPPFSNSPKLLFHCY